MLKGTFYIYMNCELWRQSHKCWMTDTWFCVSFVTHILISQNDCFIVITMSVCEMLAVSTSIQRAAVFYSFYLSHLLLRYDNRQWILRNSDIYHLFLIKSAHFSETSVEMIHVLSCFCLFSKSFLHRILPEWVSVLPSSFLMWTSMHDYSHVFLWNLMRPSSFGKVSNITLWLVSIWLGGFAVW